MSPRSASFCRTSAAAGNVVAVGLFVPCIRLARCSYWNLISRLRKSLKSHPSAGDHATSATASMRGGPGYAAFASAKFGLRAVAQSMARELGPKNIHVAHLVIDSGVDTEWVRQRRVEALGPDALDDPNLLMPPSSVAESYWLLYQQPRSAWTFELEIRPFGEKW